MLKHPFCRLSLSLRRLLPATLQYLFLSLYLALNIILLPSSITIFATLSLKRYPMGSFPLIQCFTDNSGWSLVASFRVLARLARHCHGDIPLTAALLDPSQALPVGLWQCTTTIPKCLRTTPLLFRAPSSFAFWATQFTTPSPSLLALLLTVLVAESRLLNRHYCLQCTIKIICSPLKLIFSTKPSCFSEPTRKACYGSRVALLSQTVLRTFLSICNHYQF